MFSKKCDGWPLVASATLKFFPSLKKSHPGSNNQAAKQKILGVVHETVLKGVLRRKMPDFCTFGN